MIVENQNVLIKWHNTTKKYYESKGYVFTKNGNEFEVDVKYLTKGSAAKVKFICDYCNGENQIEEKDKWKTYNNLINNRKRNNKDCCNNKECKIKKQTETQLLKPIPKGNSLAEKFPHLIEEWSERNDKTPWDYSYGTQIIVWWKCEKGHEWEMKINGRTTGQNCPYCSGNRLCVENSLAFLRPDLIKEWNTMKNENLTPHEVASKSGKRVWWIGECGHEWDAPVYERVNGRGCPYCSGKRVCSDNCLATTHPKLSEEWHPTKNGDLTPYNVTYGSYKRVWWLGKCGHEWRTLISNRSALKNGCPYCSGHKVCLDNCLNTVRPELASEWHPTKNGTLTAFSVTKGSKKKVWWRCSEGHEWQTSVSNRAKGTDCPACNESKGEKRIREFLKSHDVIFKAQYEFDYLIGVGGGLLKFDFAILKNNQIELLIEYDGEFHYKKMHEDHDYEMQVEHDKRKDKYCEINNIYLLRIPYWDFDNIEVVLTKELAKYNIIT